ncbi:MAG: hypothetical protein ACD_7C00551G0003 [uncultured bacterium]|nr:MAG: hypothetical protein ACD_7C00551G0003 [uncultured bacterium]
MKKNYVSRTILFALNVIIIVSVFIYENYFCFSGKYENKCFLSEYRDAFIEPLFYFVSSALAVSIILFFVRDVVFNKWIKLAMGMSFIMWYFILSTPVSVHSFNPIAIERELVSIWMSALFLIISIILIIIWQIKENKNR